jgi:hypothetical protein
VLDICKTHVINLLLSSVCIVSVISSWSCSRWYVDAEEEILLIGLDVLLYGTVGLTINLNKLHIFYIADLYFNSGYPLYVIFCFTTKELLTLEEDKDVIP